MLPERFTVTYERFLTCKSFASRNLCKPQFLNWKHYFHKALRSLPLEEILTQIKSHWNQASSMDLQGKKKVLPQYLLQWLLQVFQMYKFQAKYVCRKIFVSIVKVRIVHCPLRNTVLIITLWYLKISHEQINTFLLGRPKTTSQKNNQNTCPEPML